MKDTKEEESKLSHLSRIRGHLIFFTLQIICVPKPNIEFRCVPYTCVVILCITNMSQFLHTPFFLLIGTHSVVGKSALNLLLHNIA